MWYTEDEDYEKIIEEEVLSKAVSSKNTYSSAPVSPHVEFREKARSKTQGLCLFGTVPPPKKLPVDQLVAIAKTVAEAVQCLHPDAVLVYDIQDEKSRDGNERPFPFLQTHEPRVYAQHLEQAVPGLETIIYKALNSGEDKQQFSEWLTETAAYPSRNVVVVGGCAKPGELIISVSEAAKVTSENFPNICLGGITIPERHRDRGCEHTLIMEKTANGLAFFTSQVVYNADNSIAMLRDYDELCKQMGKEPVRIIFTFAPFASEAVVKFLKWLGVELPDGTVKRVLSRPNLKARVDEAIEICWENWKRILGASRRLKLSVPIGFSVESVSKSKLEQDGALELFRVLKDEMDRYYSKQHKHKHSNST